MVVLTSSVMKNISPWFSFFHTIYQISSACKYFSLPTTQMHLLKKKYNLRNGYLFMLLSCVHINTWYNVGSHLLNDCELRSVHFYFLHQQWKSLLENRNSKNEHSWLTYLKYIFLPLNTSAIHIKQVQNCLSWSYTIVR